MNTPTHIACGACLALVAAYATTGKRYTPARVAAIGAAALLLGMGSHLLLDLLPHYAWIVYLDWFRPLPYDWLICEAVFGLAVAVPALLKRIIPLLCVLMIVCGCMASRSGGDAVLSIRLTGADKSGDSIVASIKGGRTVVDVHSTSGIGRAEISPVDGRWRKPLILRLHLHGLESMSVNNGKLVIDTSVLSHPPYKQLCEFFPVGGRKGLSLEEVSPFWIHLQIENINQPGRRVIPLENGHFEVVLPDALFDGDPDTVFLQWIDFFRR